MTCKDISKWFIYHNPQLVYSYENMKLNKLLYFTQLYYYVLFNKKLFNEDFEHWDNGPVIETIYRDYKYNDLRNKVEKEELNKELFEEPLNKFLNVINLMFSNSSGDELSEETHEHNLWLDTKKNEKLDFTKIDDKLREEVLFSYNLYKDIDYENLFKLELSNNVFYYDKDFNLTEQDKEYLSGLNFMGETFFIEKINGEIVFS